MTNLRAFHGDPEIKEKYLNRVRWHREMDHLVQGVGWEQNGKTRGCAIGCTLEAYDHKLYPVELGLPEWLAHLEDRIFEGLPSKVALAWPERFLASNPVGADLEPVRHKLAIRRMDRLIEAQCKALDGATAKYGVRAAIDRTITALQTVRSCHEAEIGGDSCNVDASAAWSAARSAARSAAWSAARSVARSAAESAESAVESAAWSARSAARSAAESARSAESAAVSTAWSARSAARSAESAESATWRQEADDLVALLEKAQA